MSFLLCSFLQHIIARNLLLSLNMSMYSACKHGYSFIHSLMCLFFVDIIQYFGILGSPSPNWSQTSDFWLKLCYHVDGTENHQHLWVKSSQHVNHQKTFIALSYTLHIVCIQLPVSHILLVRLHLYCSFL